jgi:hypothetical protein
MLAALIAGMTLTTASAAEDPPTGGAWADCAVASVAAFRDRIIVRCAPPAPAKGGGLSGAAEPAVLREFAIESVGPLTDPTLRLAVAARTSGRPLEILYVKDPGANPPGCPSDRCRRIAGVELK